MAKSRARFLSELLGTTGLVKRSKSALAGADEVIDLSTLPSIPNSKLTNSSISIAGHSTALGDSVTLDTADIGEDTNLYYTNARADARIVAAGSANWNTAYGWGDHGSAGYLTSHQSLSAYLLNTTDAFTGNLTFKGENNNSKESFINVKRGDASGLWLKFQTDSTNNNNVSEFVIRRSTDSVDILNLTATSGNITFVGSVTASGGNSGNWNTAYGWGNHASAGYLTSHQSLAAYAPLASPTFTGTPAAPTATPGTNTTQIATTAYVDSAVSDIVDSAPGTLNTLNELAAALGDDENFSTTVTNSIATKLPLAGGTMTGTLNMGANAITSTGTIQAGTTSGFLYAKSLRLNNGEVSDTDFQHAYQMIVDANDSLGLMSKKGDFGGGHPFGIFFLGDNAGTTKTLGSGLVGVWNTTHFKKAHVDYMVGLYDGTQDLTAPNITVSGNLDIAQYLRHEGDTNTSIGFTGQDEITVSTGGNPRALFSSTGVHLGSISSKNSYGQLQINQTANDDESGIGILDSTSGRSMRLWCDSSNSYINSGDGGSGNLYLNEEVRVTSDGNFERVGSHISGVQIGGYDSIGNNRDKINPIYVIGSSYLPTSATDATNMYGITMSRSGGSGPSEFAWTANSGWGLGVITSGTGRIWLDNDEGIIETKSGYNVNGNTFVDSSRNITSGNITSTGTI